jgi:hypothetical protein
MKKVIKLTELELANLVKRIVSEDMEENNDLNGHIEVYKLYKNGELDKRTFYSFLGVLDRRDKERLLDYIKSEKEESMNESVDMYENTLYSDIMDLIRNSNSSHEESVSILRSIADEMTSERKVKRDAVSRFRDYRLSESDDVYTDSREEFQYDIEGVRCNEDTFTSGHVDIDEDDVIVIRYCEGNEDSIERLKRKGERLLRSKYGM